MAGGFKIKGAKKIARALKRKSKSYRNAAAVSVYQEGLAIDAIAVQLVPKDTGRLASTHYVAPPTSLWRISAEVGFGTDYALAVHERTQASHHSGFSKYLETAMKMRSIGYKKRLAERIKFNEKIGVKASGFLSSDIPKSPKVGTGGPVKYKRRKKGKGKK